ncbi:MAG TPA: hypothetical protein V6C78_23275 [Crinalium sp.]
MIYELRIYHAIPERLPALLSRFQNHTLQIWKSMASAKPDFGRR